MLPAQLLLSDLLGRRVRSDRGEDHGLGLQGWMHPPVHRLLGWASRPVALSPRRCVWRLDQLLDLQDGEVLVQGDPADSDAATLARLPTLLGATLYDGSTQPLARLVDAVIEPRSGRIEAYLVARSDPRLPGSSRWRLSPDRILDQRPGEVFSALRGLEDLPLVRASLREDLLRRSRHWRRRLDSGSSRWRQRWQQASDRFEERLEGWLEEPPWEGPRQQSPRPQPGPERDPHRVAGPDLWPEPPLPAEPRAEPWEREDGWGARDGDDPTASDPGVSARRPASRRPLGVQPAHRPPPGSGPEQDDPWV